MGIVDSGMIKGSIKFEDEITAAWKYASWSHVRLQRTSKEKKGTLFLLSPSGCCKYPKLPIYLELKLQKFLSYFLPPTVKYFEFQSKPFFSGV